jgi:tetratricopeptide (TPR) repeat protein
MTFPEVKDTTIHATRQKRQLVEQAIAASAGGDWAEAADLNRKILEYGSDSEAENRLAKALWEMGDLATAREHYQNALALDPTNRVAERNIDRLRLLLSQSGDKAGDGATSEKAPVGIFVEETGKTGFAFLVDLANPRQLAHVNPGDAVELVPEGGRLMARSNGVGIGTVEPRVASRLLKLMADGNRYSAGITSLGDKDVRLIIREVFQDPRNYGKVSFPTAAKASDLRPYTKGTLVREELDLEEELELDEEDEEISDLERVVPSGLAEEGLDEEEAPAEAEEEE